MTDSDIFFDSDPWQDVLGRTARGRALSRKYGPGTGIRVHTSALSLAEIGAKRLNDRHPLEAIEGALSVIERDSHAIHPVTAEDARSAWRLRAELRKADQKAGLTDALILSQARRLGYPLISADRAFEGQRDVRPG